MAILKKIAGKGLRAVGSRMQKKQQDKLMNPAISKMGSTRTMGTKSSFPRTTLLERRGRSRREMMDDALAAKKTGKGEGPEKKKAIRERQKIEMPKKQLTAMRVEYKRLMMIVDKTAAQKKEIARLKRVLDKEDGGRFTKSILSRAGRGGKAAAKRRADRAQRSRDEKELAGMAKSERLAAARKKKEAQIKKLEGLMKPKGPKVRRTKKFMEERKEMMRKAAAKMKGKK
jgi:hypothetical protein